MFEVQWREKPGKAWQVQDAPMFESRRLANDWIIDQPDGGEYLVVHRTIYPYCCNPITEHAYECIGEAAHHDH
jgi:hypothetical protein